MSETSLMRRKIGAPRPGDVPPPLTPERSWKRAISHGLTRAIGLEARIDSVEIGTILPEQVAERIGDGSLSVFLDGPLGYGVAVVSPGPVAAMLEMLTLGRVRTRPLPDRSVTATDAAMLADPLDRILAAQQALAAEMEPPCMAAGYRFATRIDAPREIALTLDDAAHDMVTVTLSPGGQAARAGTIIVILPRVPSPNAPDEPGDWAHRIGARVMGAEIALRTELSRMTLTVDALRALKAGDRLTLGRHAINQVRLIGPGGEALGVGRLGQSCGRKAIRIGVTPDSFTAVSPPKVSAKFETAPEPEPK